MPSYLQTLWNDRHATRKLRVDCQRDVPLRGDMEDETNLIARLLTLAGSIMEDASPVAIIDSGERSLDQRIAEVAVAADQVSALVGAAKVVRARLARKCT